MLNHRVTFVSLPSWRHLFLSCFSKPHNLEQNSALWIRPGDVSGWFSRSAWSLAKIAVWRKTMRKSTSVVVWVPDFFCNATLAPLRAMGVELLFYPVTSELQPNYVVCRQLAKHQTSDIFILVHYFGAPTPAAPAKEFCKYTGAWLVEDAAHVSSRIAGVGECGDFVLYSPHKVLPLPECALLVARPNGPAQLGELGLLALGDPDRWAEQLEEEKTLSTLITPTSFFALYFWLTKRILQKLGMRLKPLVTEYVEKETEISFSTLSGATTSRFSRRLLQAVSSNFVNMKFWRRYNALFWDALLLNLDTEKYPLKVVKQPLKQEWTPYLAVYEVPVAQGPMVFRRLQERGFPVMTWPDLPPEVLRDTERYAEAWKLRHSRIYLPVHQSLRPRQLNSKFAKHIKPSTTSNALVVSFCCEGIYREQWQAWFNQVNRSNLLQMYEYGQAKAKAEGWSIRRGVFIKQGEPIAIVQVLEKRIAGLIKVARINRGPLLLNQENTETYPAILQCLKHELAKFYRGKVLFFAPELPVSGESIRLLSEMSFYQLNPKGWHSAWLSLTQDEQVLRSGLQGKWRNMLVYAEKQNLQVRIDSCSTSFDWLISCCSTMMAERGAVALPKLLYSILRQELEYSGCPMLVFRAILDNQAVAGICIVPHGLSATYLLGWNGDEGRKIKANQLLLWQAILYLKQRGFHWFDLGGIDEENLPGISAFKKGIGAEPYELVGQGWMC